MSRDRMSLAHWVGITTETVVPLGGMGLCLVVCILARLAE